MCPRPPCSSLADASRAAASRGRYQQWPTVRQELGHGVDESAVTQVAHAVPECADAGQDQAVRIADGFG